VAVGSVVVGLAAEVSGVVASAEAAGSVVREEILHINSLRSKDKKRGGMK
jgi:hypothetical protein